MAKKVKLEDVFDFSIAGNTPMQKQPGLKEYYTQVMHGQRHLKGQVVLMNPDDFLANCYPPGEVKIYNQTFLDELPKADKYKYAIAVIDVTHGKSQGKGRAVLCKKYKLDLPVLLCGEEGDVTKWIKQRKLKVKKYA